MRSWSLALFLVTNSAWAQSPDSDAILKAIEALGNKVDSMQKDVDRLKSQSGSGAQTPASPDTQAAKSSPPAGAATAPTRAKPVSSGVSYEPGWVVDVRPQPAKGQAPESNGRFIARTDGFAFGDFRKTVGVPGWASFSGEALFDAKVAGKYVFSIRLSNSEPLTSSKVWGLRGYCSTQLSIEDHELISQDSSKFSFNAAFDRISQAGYNLEAGAYKIMFVVECPLESDNFKNPDAIFQADQNIKTWFDKVRIATSVRGPDDLTSRSPSLNELVHIAKKKASLEPPSIPTSAPRPVTVPVGTVRTATKEFNIRTAPRIDALVVVKAPPGERIEVIAKTPDDEWARVAIGGQPVGFVKGSALATNSN